MNPEYGKAQVRLHNAQNHFESVRKKLKLLRRRINGLRSETSQLEPVAAALEQKLANASASLDEARREFKRLRHIEWLKANPIARATGTNA